MRFKYVIAFIVSLMVVTAIGLGWAFQDLSRPFTISGFIVLLILEAFALISYVSRVRNDVIRFLEAIMNQDTTLQYKSRLKDPFFRSMHQVFNEVITNFRLVRNDREVERYLYSNIFNQVLVGILVFNAEGRVKVFNSSLLKMLNLATHSRIDDINLVEKILQTPLKSIRHGKERTITINLNGAQKSIAIQSSRLKLENEEIALITFNDISLEVDRKEIETWQRMIKVMRHEILNSITPVRILTSSLIEQIEMKQAEDLKLSFDKPGVNKLLIGLNAVNKRAAGLAKFVESYRDLTQSTKPNLVRLPVKDLVDHVAVLFLNQFENEGVEFEILIDDPGISILADERMVEQLLINLLRNSIEALNKIEKPKIIISAISNNELVNIKIIDNGQGIPEENIMDIFTPFFTTKENGTGIGLSLSRQIMQLHRGTISVSSEQGKGAIFELVFMDGRATFNKSVF